MSGSLVLGDWGSSRLRLWWMVDGEAVDHRTGPGILTATDKEQALGEALGDWRPERIVLCGMAGARGGLKEAPYAPCPARFESWKQAAAQYQFNGIPVSIAAGLETRNEFGVPDVMRGEETQLFGAMALDTRLSNGSHLVVLPGTHSKWVRLRDGAVESLRSFMTGELYALLSHSSLRTAGASEGDDEGAGFTTGLERASRRNALSGDLFEARAAQLCDGRSASWAHGLVSGLLIGAEVQDNARELDGRVTVIGDPALYVRYEEALAHAGIVAERMEVDKCTLAGLKLLDDN